MNVGAAEILIFTLPRRCFFLIDAEVAVWAVTGHVFSEAQRDPDQTKKGASLHAVDQPDSKPWRAFVGVCEQRWS